MTITNDKEKKPNPKLMTHQAKDTAGINASFMEVSDLISVSMACRSSQVLFSKSLTALKTKALLQAVVYSDYKKVEEILKSNPKLLFEKGTVTDYSGRVHVNRTAFQLAIGAEDFDVRNKYGKTMVDGIVELILKHFNTLPGKTTDEINTIIREQYKGQFPEGSDVLESERLMNDFSSLHQIYKVLEKTSDIACYNTLIFDDQLHRTVQAVKIEKFNNLRALDHAVIKAASNSDFDIAFEALKKCAVLNNIISVHEVNIELLKALYHFRYHLEPKTSFLMGTHFNHLLLAEAISLYIQNFAYFGNNFNPKNAFTWQKIIGYIERFVPACDAKMLAHGIVPIYQLNEKIPRSLNFNDGKGKYFPLIFRLNEGELGYGCAVGREGQTLKYAQLNNLYFVKDFILSKSNGLRSLKNHYLNLQNDRYSI
jgi:hypothetical protein